MQNLKPFVCDPEALPLQAERLGAFEAWLQYFQVNCLRPSTSLPTGEELQTSHGKHKRCSPAGCSYDCGCKLGEFASNSA